MTRAEQKRRYKLRHPDKVREGKRRYLSKRIEKRLRDDPIFLNDYKQRFINEFHTLTRLSFDAVLPRECFFCGSRSDLEIHHIRYVYPIVETDLRRLCKRCHRLEHQRITPLLN